MKNFSFLCGCDINSHSKKEWILLKLESHSFLGKFLVSFSSPRAHGICHLSYLKSKPKLVILYGLQQLQSENEKCGLVGSDSRARTQKAELCADCSLHRLVPSSQQINPSSSVALRIGVSIRPQHFVVSPLPIGSWFLRCFGGFVGDQERREKLSDPVPCNLMGPLLSFPGEISERQNSRDRVLLVIKRNHLCETSWPYAPMSSSSESCFA